MNLNLLLASLIFSILVIFIIIYFIKKDKINIKYAIIWLLLFGGLLIALIVPGFMNFLTSILGFEMSSNMIFSLLISVLVLITVSLTGIVSSQSKKIKLLIQEVSILKNKINSKQDN